MCGFPAQPLGSKRMWLNFSQRTLSGTPYCRASDTAVAKESISPETVEPSLDILMNSSPASPSSYNPTVKYPSWPPTEKWCVSARRSFGRRRRSGRCEAWPRPCSRCSLGSVLLSIWVDLSMVVSSLLSARVGYPVPASGRGGSFGLSQLAFTFRIGQPRASRIISFVQPAQHLYLRGSAIPIARLSPPLSRAWWAQDGQRVQ